MNDLCQQFNYVYMYNVQACGTTVILCDSKYTEAVWDYFYYMSTEAVWDYFYYMSTVDHI